MNPAPRRQTANTGQLVASERLHTLGQLVAGVIHELNSPLTILNANLKVLARAQAAQRALLAAYAESGATSPAIEEAKAALEAELHDEDDCARMLELCVDASVRAKHLTEEIRRYSAANSPSVAPVDLRHTLMSTVRLVDSTYRNRITFRLDIADLPSVMGIAGQLQQVFMNLLINACQAIEGRGEIRIKSQSDAAGVSITVTDTGAGIAPEHLGRVFEPYFSTKSAADGTGLGLPITKRIVENHGGTLTVESTQGVGTTFTIRLLFEASAKLAGAATPYAL